MQEKICLPSYVLDSYRTFFHPWHSSFGKRAEVCVLVEQLPNVERTVLSVIPKSLTLFYCCSWRKAWCCCRFQNPEKKPKPYIHEAKILGVGGLVLLSLENLCLVKQSLFVIQERDKACLESSVVINLITIGNKISRFNNAYILYFKSKHLFGKVLGLSKIQWRKVVWKMGRLPSSISSKTGNWTQPNHSVLAVEENSAKNKKMHASLIISEAAPEKSLWILYKVCEGLFIDWMVM